VANPEFDATEAHRFFSADCFNKTWGLIDKSSRTPEEDEQMLFLAMASLWHWTQREDHTLANLSVGYWLVSRVHAVLARTDEARRYGRFALDTAQRANADAFTLGYAYEALARAEAVGGNQAQRDEHLENAKKAATQVDNEEARGWLLDDLRTIEAAS
jgi:hypothetical protein